MTAWLPLSSLGDEQSVLSFRLRGEKHKLSLDYNLHEIAIFFPGLGSLEIENASLEYHNREIPSLHAHTFESLSLKNVDLEPAITESFLARCDDHLRSIPISDMSLTASQYSLIFQLKSLSELTISGCDIDTQTLAQLMNTNHIISIEFTDVVGIDPADCERLIDNVFVERLVLNSRVLKPIYSPK